MERVEPRVLLATLLVTTTADFGEGSLRDAINQADADSTADVIDFRVGEGGGQQILPLTPLPTVTNQVTIDGRSQPGYAGTPLIVIDNKDSGSTSSSGLTIGPGGDRSVVEGLAVVDSTASGIFVDDADDVAILADDIGYIPASTGVSAQLAANGGYGVLVSFSDRTVIGSPGLGNVILGNALGGISLGPQSSTASIRGNSIGALPIPDSQIGLAPQQDGNRGPGILATGTSGTTIGGASSGDANLISGNAGGGIQVTQGSSNLVQGNAVGTSSSGELAIPNVGFGVEVVDSSSNTVGGTAAGSGNLISGNVQGGLLISGTQASGNVVQGDVIGLDRLGVAKLGNGGEGILVMDAPGNAIGGPATGSGDIIAGNSGDGVGIMGAGSSLTLVESDQIRFNSGQGISISAAPSNSILSNIIARNGLNGVAIAASTLPGNLLLGNLIGTDPAGDQADNNGDGVVVINSAGNTIGGTLPTARNVVSSNAGEGISLRGPGATGNRVLGNFIGTAPSGSGQLGNLLDGILVLNAAGNTIGGPSAAARNVIAANRNGILLQTGTASELGPAAAALSSGLADRNLIQGNWIGTDASGEASLGNFQDGIDVFDGSSNTIGGTTPGSGNLISNNLTNGVDIGSDLSATDPGPGDLVEGNVVGLDVTRTIAMGNGQAGVRLALATAATIGGPAAGAGNVISGNTNGVDVLGSPGVFLGDLVAGNVIGLGGDGEELDPIAPGQPALRNTSNGVVLEQAAAGVTIGGASPGDSNVISGNGSAGVRLQAASSGDLIEGNRIGVGVDGLTPRANNESGVFVSEGSSGNTIGGSTAGSANVISGNSSGVTLTNAGTTGNLVEGNLVGLGLDGSTMVGNLGFGVLVMNGASFNTVGGASSASRNVISGNGQGVGIAGPGAIGNLVERNYVGLDATGSSPRGNLQLGVFLNAAVDNTIGGTAPGAGNVVSGNAGVGIEVFGAGSTGNLVAGNLVGLDATGSRVATAGGLSLGNNGFGVQVQDAPLNTIGGTTPGSRNTISGNRQAGVAVAGASSLGTFVQGNFIGLDAGGSIALGNLGDGVLVDAAPSVAIGGYGAAAGNVISGNQANGVDIVGSGSTGDEVLGNFVGTDLSGLRALGNGQSGVAVNASPGVVVGGAVAPIRNVISANGADGVLVAGAASIGTQVLGNLIGLDATGRAALGNGNDGVLLLGAEGVSVGGTGFGMTNVISANAAAGVEFAGSTTSYDALEGNLIGTDAGGTVGIGNSTGVLLNGSPGDVVGGTVPGAGNLISGNVSLGVHLLGTSAFNDAVQGNEIGTDLAGSASIPNLAGVFLDGSGSDVVSGDLISGNVSSGVILQGTAASGDQVFGNRVGVDATGTRAVSPGRPQQTGILLIDAPGNVIGGQLGTARNVVSGNLVGLDISGFNAQRNVVLGNYVGTDATGRVAVPDTVGIYINGSPGNFVGGSAPYAGNLISGNTAVGVELYGTLASGNVVQGNVIGTDITGTLALGNGSGVYLDQADSNTIGGASGPAGNLISGNSVAGVYFFDAASGNLVQGNRIGVSVAGRALGNGEYGVLLYNAANNTVDMSATTGNLIANSGIGNFREFTGAVPTASAASVSASTTTTTTSTASKKAKAVVKVTHPAGPKVSSKAISLPGLAAGSASSRRSGR